MLKRKINSFHAKLVNKLLGKTLDLKVRDEVGGIKTVEIIDMHKRISYGKWRVIFEMENQPETSLVISKEYWFPS